MAGKLDAALNLLVAVQRVDELVRLPKPTIAVMNQATLRCNAQHYLGSALAIEVNDGMLADIGPGPSPLLQECGQGHSRD